MPEQRQPWDELQVEVARLRAAERRLQAAFDQGDTLRIIAGADGTMLELSRSVIARMAVDPAVAIGRPLWEAEWWPRLGVERAVLRDLVAAAARGTAGSCPATLPGSAGMLRQAELVVRPLLQDAGSFALVLCEERALHLGSDGDQLLRASEQRYRQLFENMAAGFALHEIIVDAQGRPSDYRYLEVNPAFERLTGIKAAMLVGRTLREVMPGTEERWIETFGRVALTGVPIEVEDYSRVLDRWYEVRAFCPQPRQFAVVFSDVSPRRRAEESLRTRERDLVATLRSLGDAVIAADAGGVVTRMNPMAELLTGWSGERALGRPLDEIFRLERAGDELPSAGSLPPGKAVGGYRSGRQRLTSAAGASHEISLNAAPILDDDQAARGVVLVFRDIGEQLVIEEQLRRAQKMETIGRLAGGVAHDFNNLLTGILGYAERLEHQLRAQPQARAHAHAITLAAGRAGQLTRQLLAFSRTGNRSAVPVDLNQLIAEVAGLVRASIDRRIAVETVLSGAPAWVVGDPSQLQAALLNLAVNARDSMPEGGELRISCASISFASDTALGFAQLLTAGRYLAVAVRDSGTGIAPAAFEHLFEPFFTTKEVGKGTGLGLAAVYGTLRDHRGGISVTSASGAGSTFTAYLPYEEPPAAPPQADSGCGLGLAMLQGSGRILVVDDEDFVRDLIAAQLEDLGYQVVVARDGREAAEIFARDHAGIDAVLLDTLMPRLGGAQALGKLRAIAPGVPVVMLSGYCADVEALIRAGANAFLAKPFTAAELALTVARALKR